MKKYKVIDPNGVLLNGFIISKGEFLPGGFSGSQLTAWLRFGQVEELQADKDKPTDMIKVTGK